MIEVETYALREAESLPIGMPRRMQCPVCRGGDKSEHSFVVGREPDRVWWKCFRAKCGARGHTGSACLPAAVKAERDRALDKVRPYELPLYALEDSDLEYFGQRFEITPVDARVTSGDAYALAVRDPRGATRGWVVRQPVWKGTPKAPRSGQATYYDGSGFVPTPKTVLYPHTTDPMLSWYGPALASTSNTLVIVEDQVSAMKVAQHTGAWAVALLGNGMNAEMMREIFKQHFARAIFALDPGAEKQALNLVRNWGLYFKTARAVLMERDPKDTPAYDLDWELGLC